MNIEYLIKLWQSCNLDTIFIKNLPVSVGVSIIEPTTILTKTQKLCLGKEMSVYDYLREIYNNALFQFIDADDMLYVKVIALEMRF